jgi:hypothetical protein
MITISLARRTEMFRSIGRSCAKAGVLGRPAMFSRDTLLHRIPAAGAAPDRHHDVMRAYHPRFEETR